jgi:SAM-dependent methyltransferase
VDRVSEQGAGNQESGDQPAVTLQCFSVGNSHIEAKVRPRLGYLEVSPDVHWFWQMHPRITFTKALTLDSVILDFGAGDGHFYTSRTDYQPIRNDQKFYALDLFKGEHFDLYDDAQIADFEQENLKWDASSIDGVMASHVLEHLHDMRRFFDECARVLKPGGLIYVETPASFTGGLPSSDKLRDQGLPMIASNFFEDSTHVRTISNAQIAATAALAGFSVQQGGVIQSDYFGDALVQYAQQVQDVMYGMFGYWAKTGWAQYLILRKPDQFDHYKRDL